MSQNTCRRKDKARVLPKHYKGRPLTFLGVFQKGGQVVARALRGGKVIEVVITQAEAIKLQAL